MWNNAVGFLIPKWKQILDTVCFFWNGAFPTLILWLWRTNTYVIFACEAQICGPKWFCELTQTSFMIKQSYLSSSRGTHKILCTLTIKTAPTITSSSLQCVSHISSSSSLLPFVKGRRRGRLGLSAPGIERTSLKLFQLGGQAQKTWFFQMVPKSFLSGLVYSTWCEYDILKVLKKQIDQNPPVGCIKLLFGISGRKRS